MSFGPARWRNAVWWILPTLFALAYHWRTLSIWFRADDFAWLGLRLSVQRPGDLLTALFAPMAQGTVRFLSERTFFLTFETLFGLNALPFRIAVLAAQAGACVLMAWILKRLTGSVIAAVAGPALWTVSVGLAAAIGWLSSANQVFLALFFLGSLAAFVAGRTWLSLVLFLLGFGVLESMIVLPAALLAYAALFDRLRWRTAVLFAIPSAGFAWLHFRIIPKIQTDPAYQIYLDPASIWETLRTYWSWAATPGAPALTLAVALTLLAVWTAWRREWTVAWGLACFLFLLAPVLPLREHRLHYYLGAPGIGVAIALGAGIGSLAASGRIGIIAAALLAILYAAGQTPQSRQTIEWNREKSRAVRSLVRGVEAARRLHPGDAILLSGISNTLFWDGVFDNPFRILGMDRVYLAPGAERAIDQHPEWGGINDWIIPPATARELLENDRVEVYEPRSESLANVTAAWKQKAHLLGNELSRFVDAGDPAFDRQLKDGWEDLFERSRWMGREAAVELSTQAAEAGELVVAAWCPKGLAAGGPVDVEAWVGGHYAGKRAVPPKESLFELVFPLPSGARGLARAEVRLRANRTFRTPEDGRDLSFVFGSIQIR